MTTDPSPHETADCPECPHPVEDHDHRWGCVFPGEGGCTCTMRLRDLIDHARAHEAATGDVGGPDLVNEPAEQRDDPNFPPAAPTGDLAALRDKLDEWLAEGIGQERRTALVQVHEWLDARSRTRTVPSAPLPSRVPLCHGRGRTTADCPGAFGYCAPCPVHPGRAATPRPAATEGGDDDADDERPMTPAEQADHDTYYAGAGMSERTHDAAAQRRGFTSSGALYAWVDGQLTATPRQAAGEAAGGDGFGRCHACGRVAGLVLDDHTSDVEGFDECMGGGTRDFEHLHAVPSAPPAPEVTRASVIDAVRAETGDRLAGVLVADRLGLVDQGADRD